MLESISANDLDRRIAKVEAIVGHTFRDKNLIVAAITHPSALEDGNSVESYERLEFLGDSVVGGVMADAIYRRFPTMDEGGMTRVKAELVSGTSLSQVSKELGIADIIIFGGSETGTGIRGLHSALENVFESITGALYLDAGIDAAQQWVLRCLGSRISDEYAKEPENPKSSLQEILQEDRVTPTYHIIEVDGPPHDRTFTSEVYSGDTCIGRGSGRSKKEAEAAAAHDALVHMEHTGA